MGIKAWQEFVDTCELVTPEWTVESAHKLFLLLAVRNRELMGTEVSLSLRNRGWLAGWLAGWPAGWLLG